MVCVVGLVVTGNVGGNAMVWHGRLGYAVLTLLLFRLVWGFVGGRWSRFGSFVVSPKTTFAYLRGQTTPERSVGHNPLGAWSVLALLLVLFAQVGSGLFADDEIAFTGPLAGLVSGDWVSTLTRYHKDVGKLQVQLDLADQRGPAEPGRVADHRTERQDQRPQKAQQAEHAAAISNDKAAHPFRQARGDRQFFGFGFFFQLVAVDRRDQALRLVAGTDDVRPAFARQPPDQPGPDRIDLMRLADVDSGEAFAGAAQGRVDPPD